MLTMTQMRSKLRAAVEKAGGQKQFAEQIDVSPQYVDLNRNYRPERTPLSLARKVVRT